MWLVERITDYEYEGEARKALFVTENETMAKDFCIAADIEATAGATIPMPQRLHAFDGLRKKDGTVYGLADHEADLAAYYEQIRTIVTLDKMADDEFSSLRLFSYEAQEVEVR